MQCEVNLIEQKEQHVEDQPPGLLVVLHAASDELVHLCSEIKLLVLLPELQKCRLDFPRRMKLKSVHLCGNESQSKFGTKTLVDTSTVSENMVSPYTWICIN